MRNKLLQALLLLLLQPLVAQSSQKIGAGERVKIAQTLSRIVDREIKGVSVRVTSINASRKAVRIETTIGLSYYPFRPENVDAIYDSVRQMLPTKMAQATIKIFTDGREISNLIPMAYMSDDRRSRMVAFTNRSEKGLVTKTSESYNTKKSLSGRHIALWQSHGRYYDQEKNLWQWQRSRQWETCEDLFTQGFVIPYLVPMLERAGAYVLMPRERDLQKHEVIADNDNTTSYKEVTGVKAWGDGGVGFAHLQEVYHDGQNPFRQGKTRMIESVKSGKQSTATWSAKIPQKGEYAIYVSYLSNENSADDARYTVHYAGGEVQFSVNQTMGGGTWIYLGSFVFEAGDQKVITLSNLSRMEKRTISADAVKIGGGYGNIARTTSDSMRYIQRAEKFNYMDETSGYPRFCEGSRYWLQWAGFDQKVYRPKWGGDDYKEDFMSRALWVNALMGGSERLPDSTGLRIPIDLALAFHTDAGVKDGDEVIGTLGIYCTRDNGGKFFGGADRYRSRDLTDLIMTQIVGDIRSEFEPTWRRRGLWNRSYYEARVPNVPTMLLELLSHQNFADMRYGHDPKFKFMTSRAIYKGIVRYICSQYNQPYVVQPLPVEEMSSEFVGERALKLSWSPVEDPLESTATPTSYIVYTRVGNGGFDSGRRVESTTLLTEQLPGVVYSYQVTAINDGGESMPSEIMTACSATNSKATILIVNGFDRISGTYSTRTDSTAGFYRTIDPGVADRRDISFIGAQNNFDITQARCDVDSLALGACSTNFETDVLAGNSFDYPIIHGSSIARAGYSFCSTSLKAVENSAVKLSSYKCVDLILGRQRTTRGMGINGEFYQTFSTKLQGALRDYLEGGGALFASGSYICSDLMQSFNSEVTNTSESENNTHDNLKTNREFAREVLHMEYDGKHSSEQNRVRVTTSIGGFSRGDYHFNNEYRDDIYRVESSDAMRPADKGSIAVMRYTSDGRTAAVAHSGKNRTFVVGFPFETIVSEFERDKLMSDALNFLVK